MRLQVEDLVRYGRPVCVFDPRGDWWGVKLNRSGQGPGYPVIIFGDEHADIPLTIALEDLGADIRRCRAVALGRRRIVDLW